MDEITSTTTQDAPTPQSTAEAEAGRFAQQKDRAGQASAEPSTAQEIADTLMRALDNRQKRATNSVVASIAEQYGMSEKDVTALLEAERQKRASAVTPEQRRQIDEATAKAKSAIENANARLISAEVRLACASLGIIDPDAALALMDKSGVAVDESGNVSGVKEALEALAQAKPYLCRGAEPAASTGSTGNFPRADAGKADYSARLADARRLGDRVSEVRIIAEASAHGITLR